MRVSYAYKNAKQQFDEHPPGGDLIPIAAAIHAWVLICGCYMGIEQTLKLLIKMRDEKTVPTGTDGHNLQKLHSLLTPSEQGVVADYYRVYRSLHNFDSRGVRLETSVEFFRYIGKGYTRWRYILFDSEEKSGKVPAIHLGLMLEVWRALVALVDRKIWGHDPTKHTLAADVENYIIVQVIREVQQVIREAEKNPEWKAAARDEGVEFSDICRWVQQNGGTLKAGVDLIGHYARGTGDSLKASPLMRRVLLKAVEKAISNPMERYKKNQDIEMLIFRTTAHDEPPLTWNPTKRVFENAAS